MKRARFRVVGRLHMASAETAGTVTIDRAKGLFDVRPLHSRKTYTLPLGDVATMVCQRLLRAEAFKRRLERAKKRGGR